MTPAFDCIESTSLRGLARDLHADGWQISCAHEDGDVVRVGEPRLEVYHDGAAYYVLDVDGEVLSESTEFDAIVGTLYGLMQSRLADERSWPDEVDDHDE